VYLRAKHGVEIPFVKADIRDYNEIESVIRKHEINGIVHTAALKAVGESMEKSDEYFQVNLEATTELLRIAERNGVKKFIFSSTAAVYGSPDSIDPCTEDGPKAPISPYGDSKYQAESKVTAFINTPGNHGTSLRFFNVVGAAAPELLDNSVENLVPIVLGKLNKGEAPTIFGTDYSTPDGTCIRDYVDVRDIARAHLAAADATTKLPETMNIGTGRGASVREIIKLVLDATKKSETKVIEVERRAGDPAFLCADVTLAKSTMGFESKYSLEESVRSLF
jgi:UDP-glucose 4-epimerase